MSENDGKKTLGVRSGPRASNVKQSFSHGRSKNVVVETKRKRVVVPKAGTSKTSIQSSNRDGNITGCDGVAYSQAQPAPRDDPIHNQCQSAICNTRAFDGLLSGYTTNNTVTRLGPRHVHAEPAMPRHKQLQTHAT